MQYFTLPRLFCGLYSLVLLVNSFWLCTVCYLGRYLRPLSRAVISGCYLRPQAVI